MNELLYNTTRNPNNSNPHINKTHKHYAFGLKKMSAKGITIDNSNLIGMDTPGIKICNRKQFRLVYIYNKLVFHTQALERCKAAGFPRAPYYWKALPRRN